MYGGIGGRGERCKLDPVSHLAYFREGVFRKRDKQRSAKIESLTFRWSVCKIYNKGFAIAVDVADVENHGRASEET